MSTTPSRAWLKENVTCASFDDDLWVLLQSKEWRTRLREYIVEHKLSDGRWLHRITEGLKNNRTMRDNEATRRLTD